MDVLYQGWTRQQLAPASCADHDKVATQDELRWGIESWWFNTWRLQLRTVQLRHGTKTYKQPDAIQPLGICHQLNSGPAQQRECYPSRCPQA